MLAKGEEVAIKQALRARVDAINHTIKLAMLARISRRIFEYRDQLPLPRLLQAIKVHIRGLAEFAVTIWF